MKKLMVILLGLISWQTMAMYDLAASLLGVTRAVEKKEVSKQVEPSFAKASDSTDRLVGEQPVHVQQKIEPITVLSKEGQTVVNITANIIGHIDPTITGNINPTINPTINPAMTQNMLNSTDVETHNQAQANAQAEATAQAQAAAEVKVKVSQLWNTHRDSMQALWDENKLYFAASALLALYSYYLYQVVCGNLYLKRIDLWSSWKNGLSFDQLCAIPQQALARELILSIQHQGLDVQKPTDFTVPLVTFLQVIEEERKTLLYYQTLHSRITMVKCGMLFPFNKKRYDRIEERLQRLSFVKNIFISWMAEFNLEHAKSVPGVVF